MHALVAGFVITPLSYDEITSGIPARQPLTFTIGSGVFYYGDLLGYAITLALVGLLVAGAVRLAHGRLWDDSPVRECPFCLSDIPAAATVCSACGRETPAAST